MPNCFTLCKKEDPKTPVAFSKIDDELRVHFEEPPDDKTYLGGWYDLVGTALAHGMTWDKMREIFEGEGMLAIVDYLEEHYVSSAWYQHK